MKRMLFVICTLMLTSSLTKADDLVPATSNDVSNFDSQVAGAKKEEKDVSGSKEEGQSASHRNDKKSKRDKDNFGSVVSAEANRLKESDQDGKRGMGKWVSTQRRQDDQKHPDISGGPGTPGVGSTNADAHSAAPRGTGDTKGNESPSGHGQDGNHGH